MSHEREGLAWRLALRACQWLPRTQELIRPYQRLCPGLGAELENAGFEALAFTVVTCEGADEDAFAHALRKQVHTEVMAAISAATGSPTRRTDRCRSRSSRTRPVDAHAGQ